jgi:hypothetical protein
MEFDKMADEVDTRVSLSFDPGIIEGIPDYDEETLPVLGQTQTALSEAFNALRSIHDAKAAAATNPTLNEFAQLIEVDNYATKRMDPVVRSWDRTIDTLNSNINAARMELKQPIEFKASLNISTEIRAHFRSLDMGERMGLLRRAIDQDDAVTATAVLGTRSYLSGFDDEIHQTFVDEWQAKQMPVQAKRLRAMQAAADLLNDRVKLLKSEWAKAVGVVEETKEGRRGERIVTRRWTPAEVRARVKASNESFAVPV